MSIVKDAERIGDYAKNIWDIANQAYVTEAVDVPAVITARSNAPVDGVLASNAIFDLKVDRELVTTRRIEPFGMDMGSVQSPPAPRVSIVVEDDLAVELVE